MSEPERNAAPDEAVRHWLRLALLPFAACLVFFCVTPSGEWPLRHSSPEVVRAIRSVVEAQFEAFRDDDYSRARSYASAEIQRQFTTAAFERMVKGGYPGIAFWQKVSFGAVADNGHEAIIEVSVTSRRGHTRNFRYLLIREGELWRINGVVEFEPTATGQFV